MGTGRGLGLVLAVLVPAVCAAQDAPSVLEAMRQKQVDRAEGVDAYRMTRETVGQQLTEYYQRFDVTGDDGLVYPVFQQVKGSDLKCGSGASKMSPEALEAYAAGLEMTGDAVAGGVEQGLADAGLPPGLFAGMGAGGDPWATTDMRRMTGSMATFSRAAAVSQREGSMGSGDPMADGEGYLDFARSAELVGMEEVDGADAYHLRAEGLNQTHEEDGQSYTMDAMSLWVDVDELVPLMMRMEGTATSRGETRDFSIEKVDSDYRSVPGSNLYESYRQIMRIGGAMDEEQKAQMAEAQKQMAEFEKQMAEMPANQRQMMEQMMGPQLEMMRKMAKGGGFEIETTVAEISVLDLAAADCSAGSVD